jgi:hypothetical protein
MANLKFCVVKTGAEDNAFFTLQNTFSASSVQSCLSFFFFVLVCSYSSATNEAKYFMKRQYHPARPAKLLISVVVTGFGKLKIAFSFFVL